jgi:hypothetical protein
VGDNRTLVPPYLEGILKVGPGLVSNLCNFPFG